MPLDTRIPLMAQPLQMPDFNALAMQRQQQDMNAFNMRRLQQQDEAAQAASARRAQVGGLAAGGDYAGAGKAALEGGDFELYNTISGLDGEQRKAAAERNKIMAALALSAADLPYEQRRSLLRAAEPHLAQFGFAPEQIEGFDPTDENIAGIVATTRDLEKMLAEQAKANEPYTLSQGQSRFVGNREIASIAPEAKYLTVPEGGTAYRIDGGGLSPAGGTPSPAGTTGSSIPFEALIELESGGNHFTKGGGVLTSPKGAIGIAQVMPSTGPDAARAAGLEWDEARYRSDPSYNRALGEGYYNSLRQRYGNDLLAAAAYNAGPGRVDAALKQGGDNWLSLLPRETQSYVARLPQNSMARGGPPAVIRGAPKAPAKGPDAPSGYRWTAKGDLEPIPGGPATQISQGTKQQQGLARQKVSGLRAIEGQIARVEKAMEAMEKDGYSGAILGMVPGRLDAASNTFDKAVAGLSPLLRALTRVPGEGAMSDYESRLAQAIMPSRTDTPEARREALATMRDLVRNTLSGYQEFLGTPAQSSNVIRYDAKGNRIK